MSRAVEYDRAVGYFRSAAFIIAWPALRQFVAQKGRIRDLVLAGAPPHRHRCALTRDTLLEQDAIIAARMTDEVAMLLEDEVMSEAGPSARCARCDRCPGVQDRHLCVQPRAPQQRGSSMTSWGFSEMVRAIKLIFKGSMNETWSGLASDGNLRVR